MILSTSRPYGMPGYPPKFQMEAMGEQQQTSNIVVWIDPHTYIKMTEDEIKEVDQLIVNFSQRLSEIHKLTHSRTAETGCG
jgi:hypothetical protein